MQCLWPTLGVRGWRNHPGRVRSRTQHKAALFSLCRCPKCPSSLEKNCLFMWLGVDGAIFLRGLIVLLTAQIIRNENPGVRATAPSAVNMFQPHLAGGLEGSYSHPPHPQQKRMCSGGWLQELPPGDLQPAGSAGGRLLKGAAWSPSCMAPGAHSRPTKICKDE